MCLWLCQQAPCLQADVFVRGREVKLGSTYRATHKAAGGHEMHLRVWDIDRRFASKEAFKKHSHIMF